MSAITRLRERAGRFRTAGVEGQQTRPVRDATAPVRAPRPSGGTIEGKDVAFLGEARKKFRLRPGLCCEPLVHFDVSLLMDQQNEKRELERKLARYRALLVEFPDGDIAAALRDLIDELEQQLRSLDRP
jgi:hypothetical protein